MKQFLPIGAMHSVTSAAFFDRQLRLQDWGEEVFSKLQQTKVLIIGMGGLGCPVAESLLRTGIGNLGLLDGDTISESNLHRQSLYSAEDIGKPKSACAKARLLNICPHVQIEIFPEFINPKNAINIITQYDVVVDGTDNFDARYLISDACSALQKPLVYASIEGFQIQLSVFSYQKGHTLRCLFPERHDAPTCADNGVMSPVTQLAGNLQAMEVLKIVSGNGKVSEGVLKMVDVLNGEVSNFQFKKSDFPEQYSVKKFQEFYHCSSEMKSITVQELKEWMDSGKEFQLIDVREPEEWAICQLDSIQIPLGKLMQKVNDLDETMPTVLLCHHGFRSAQAAGLLLQHDFQEVYNLKGGIHQWAVQIDTSMQTY